MKSILDQIIKELDEAGDDVAKSGRIAETLHYASKAAEVWHGMSVIKATPLGAISPILEPKFADYIDRARRASGDEERCSGRGCVHDDDDKTPTPGATPNSEVIH